MEIVCQRKVSTVGSVNDLLTEWQLFLRKGHEYLL